MSRPNPLGNLVTLIVLGSLAVGLFRIAVHTLGFAAKKATGKLSEEEKKNERETWMMLIIVLVFVVAPIACVIRNLTR